MTHLLEKLLDRRDLSEVEAAALLDALARDDVEPAVAGAVLAALRSKGESAAEVRGLAGAMRRLALRPALPDGAYADIVGTGGDGAASLNLSTGAALLAAAAGVPIVKHGNRAISSRCGAADLLEALHLPMPMPEPAVSACFRETGFTFLFAPQYHQALRALVAVRRSLKVRTVFNLLGPLTNPAGPRFGVLGAWSEPVARLMADALAGMPIERYLVVHGADGWDEPTPIGAFVCFDVRPQEVQRRVLEPREFGLPRCTAADLQGGDARYNAAALLDVFAGQRGAYRDALLLNCALLLMVTRRCATPEQAIARGAEAIDQGHAAELVRKLQRVAREAALD